MLNKIISWAIRHPWATIVLSVGIVVLGGWSLATMKVDVLPNVNKPTVAIFAEGEGLAPEEIERLILTPIEGAVAGAPGVERVRGTASFGLAITQVEFKWGSDVYRNRQIIQERLNQINLPSGVRPVLGPVASVMGEIMWAGLTATDTKIGGMELRSLADWTIRPALLRVPGVSDVIILGGDVREWQINLNAERLRRLGLSIADITTQVEGALKNRGGGILIQSQQEYPIRILVAPSKIDELKEIGIGSRNGQSIRLADVATVVEGASPVRGGATIDGKPGIIMRIVKQPEAETLAVTAAIDKTLTSLQAGLPPGTELKNDLFRQEWFIHAGLSNVLDALRDGTILVIVILILFLMNLRTTAITLTAIPMSILVTAIIFRAFDLSVNVMTLGGIAVAIGELVDDAIVGVENVFHRMKDWIKGGRQEAFGDVVFRASSEVRNSIVYATILVAIVFLPIFFIPGVEGKLIAPLGLAYLISLVASMVVSLTLTPALCTVLLGKLRTNQNDNTRVARWIKQKITPGILWSIGHAKFMMIGVVATLAVAGVLYTLAGKEGIPPFNEGAVTIGVVMPVGTDLDTSNAFASKVEDAIRKIQGIQRASHSTGRAGADAHDSGANTSEIQVAFQPGLEKERKRLFAEIQTTLDGFTGADFGLGQPITHKLEELISGVRAPIVIKVFGDDLVAIRQVAAQVQAELAKQQGVTNAQVQREVIVPEFRIYPNRNRLAELGLSSGEVAEQLEAGLLGTTVGQVQLGSARVDVVTRFDIASRGNASALRDLALPFEGVESLGSAADIRLEGGRNRLSHDGGRRVLVVSANYQGKDIVGAVEAAKQTLESQKLPAGTTLSFEGTYKSQKENSRRLALLFLVGLILIFGVLYHAFKSVPIVLQIMINIPTAFIGGMIGVWLTGGVISLAHLIGFISLAGIVSRNGIMLISHCLHLVRDKKLPFTPETIMHGTLNRVVPVLMTALTALLALIPFLLAGEAPGKEMLHPLAVVIFGGLTSSTLISLFLTPALFYRFGKKAAEEKMERAAEFE
ncbi:MAG: efflux RND transporter permease subunit [Candidatus Magasanikbacteria bacterium]|nr:efflux RND transporter permease subunit [Candidatus Magasanikbacteria bacterium]